MAANTDKFRKQESNFSTTLSSSITDSDTTIPLSSTSGLPTDTGITLTIDRVDANGASTPSSMERVTGVISGNNLTNALRGEDDSSAQAHSSGAVVEVIWDGETWNDAVDGMIAEHNQDGTHSSITADDVTTDSVTAETTNGDLTLAGDGTGTVIKPGAASVQVSVKGSDLETGDGKAYLIIPDELNGLDLTDISAQVAVAPVGATITVQLHNVTDSADILSTALTIDASETTSETAATPAVINTANDDVASNDLLRVDVDQVGSSTAGEALVVLLRFS